MGVYAGPGITPSLKGQATNRVTLQSGAVQILPAGPLMVKVGGYTALQQYDPITGLWWKIGGGGVGGSPEYIYSDGVNYRLANQTGAVVGALLTNGGTGYTSAPAVAASAGGSIWRAIVGGALSTTVTVTNGGSTYTYPPEVVISAPPPGGIQATGYCTLTSGAVSSVTIVNQGAGYTSPPTITFTNDPREGQNGVASGYNAAATGILTGAGTVTGLLCIDHGLGGQTAIVTLTFSGGGGASAAATAIMCWTITALTISAVGAGLAANAAALVTALDSFPVTAPAYTNPATQSGLVSVRNANIRVAVSAGALVALATTAAVFTDSGIYTSAPVPLVMANASIVTTAPIVTCTVGGATDTSYYTPV